MSAHRMTRTTKITGVRASDLIAEHGRKPAPLEETAMTGADSAALRALLAAA